MACGCNSINNTCGEAHYAACTHYEGALPAFTTLASAECYTVEEILADIYSIETIVNDEIDLSELLTNGIVYTLVDSKIITRNALKKHAELLIAMQAVLNGIADGTNDMFNITGWGLDFECIADICDNPPTHLKDLIQLMITQICDNIAP